MQPPLPIERLGDFELLPEIGHEGMGVVYQTRQLSRCRFELFWGHHP
jgi:hypothetical protein